MFNKESYKIKKASSGWYVERVDGVIIALGFSTKSGAQVWLDEILSVIFSLDEI